jgi:SAM-dependent methyltransferase
MPAKSPPATPTSAPFILDPAVPYSPAADRNKAPIVAALQRLLSPQASVLEVASGTGQHAAHFAATQPSWQWQPSDADPHALPAIQAHTRGLPNVAAALHLDLLSPTWPAALAASAGTRDALYCANMLHIAPWATCAALMQLAAQQLKPQAGQLLIYGPFIVEGTPTAPSNLAFDANLKAQDSAWGLRTLAAVQREAQAVGLGLSHTLALPANNLLLVFHHS